MDLSGYSLTITSGVRGIDVKIKELALRQGVTRFAWHTYSNLMQAGRRIINKEYDKNDIINMISFFVYKKHYAEAGG